MKKNTKYNAVMMLFIATLIVLLLGCNASYQADPVDARKTVQTVRSAKDVSAPTDGTGMLVGTITGAPKEMHLANIVVEDINKTWTGVTDSNGDFVVTMIKPDIYDINVYGWEYNQKTFRGVAIKGNSITKLEIPTPVIEPEIVEECEASSPRVNRQSLKLDALMSMNEVKVMACESAPPSQISISGQSRKSRYCSQIYGAGGQFSTTSSDHDFNTESYNRIYPNAFLDVIGNPLSTFSIDVDAASYSNIRRFINDGDLPPRDAVRIEEMVNYFTYDYPQPLEKHPFSINTEIALCPWDSDHQIVHIGLQGKRFEYAELQPNNLVFLLDVSGSMDQPNKLPLLKSAFRMLVGELRPQDRVAIVVYAGSAGLVLPSTPGNMKREILDAIGRLQAGGSTAGGAGIQLAYKIAQENFATNSNNRVILATDGDFNIGMSSDAEMIRLIEEKRKSGVFLTVLGFGTGNLKDSRMEQIADKGNGNYSYIDNIHEARKVLVSELGATLVTIAKDVKIQVEFNPAEIQAYRLIGYENRMLNKEDFNDDLKDAGELGAGHSVTALYEIVPKDVHFEQPKVDDLKYQTNEIEKSAFNSNEMMTVKLRYKKPDSEVSKLIEMLVKGDDMRTAGLSDNFNFSLAVAEFGMLLRDSEFKGNSSYKDVISRAKASKGRDEAGYRAEFIRLVETAQMLQKDMHSDITEED